MWSTLIKLSEALYSYNTKPKHGLDLSQKEQARGDPKGKLQLLRSSPNHIVAMLLGAKLWGQIQQRGPTSGSLCNSTFSSPSFLARGCANSFNYTLKIQDIFREVITKAMLGTGLTIKNIGKACSLTWFDQCLGSPSLPVYTAGTVHNEQNKFVLSSLPYLYKSSFPGASRNRSGSHSPLMK